MFTCTAGSTPNPARYMDVCAYPVVKMSSCLLLVLRRQWTSIHAYSVAATDALTDGMTPHRHARKFFLTSVGALTRNPLYPFATGLARLLDNPLVTMCDLAELLMLQIDTLMVISKIFLGNCRREHIKHNVIAAHGHMISSVSDKSPRLFLS
jgi:hypothetical protein